MDKLRRLSAYMEIYYATATQHRTAHAAREWMEARVSAEDAAAWANAGYLPGEAAPYITRGVTPAMAAEMEDLAVEIAGSREEHAMQVIDRLVAMGILVDPRRVQQRADPDDPNHIIVSIDPK